jgi:hypothetical protein
MLENIEQKLQQKSSQKLVRGAIGFFVFLASLPSLSAELIDPKTKEVNLKLLAQMQHTAGPRSLNIANYVSYNSLPQYDDGSRAGLKVLGQAAKALVNSQQPSAPTQAIVNKVKIAKSAQTAHMNFALNLSAAGAHAEMSYGNSLKAVASYDGSTAMKVEVSHPINVNQSIAYVHSPGPYGGTEDKLGYRWGF